MHTFELEEEFFAVICGHYGCQSTKYPIMFLCCFMMTKSKSISGFNLWEQLLNVADKAAANLLVSS